MGPITRRSLHLGGALLSVSGQIAIGADAGPQAAAGAFYAAYLKLQPSGIPDEPDLAKLHPLLSPALNQLLTEAARAEAAYAKKTAGEAPPLAEGDVFTSLFEGANAYTIVSCDDHSATATCAVALTGAGEDDAQTKWQDKIELIRGKNAWLVDDIDYGANWDFGPHGTLKSSLKALLADSKGK